MCKKAFAVIERKTFFRLKHWGVIFLCYNRENLSVKEVDRSENVCV